MTDRLLTTREVAAFLGFSLATVLRGLRRLSLDPDIEVDAMAIDDGFTLADLGLHHEPSVENLCAHIRNHGNVFDFRRFIWEPVADRVPGLDLLHEAAFTPFWAASR